MRRLGLALSLALVAGCHDGTGVSALRASVAKEANGIRLTNLTDRAQGYFLVDKNTLALIDWVPCAVPTPDCLRLPANGSVLVPFDEIVMGGANSVEVLIYTWWVLPDAGGAGHHVDLADPLTLRMQYVLDSQ